MAEEKAQQQSGGGGKKSGDVMLPTQMPGSSQPMADQEEAQKKAEAIEKAEAKEFEDAQKKGQEGEGPYGHMKRGTDR